MKNITLFITAMSSGGAEHQLSMLAAFLAEEGYDVTLVTFADLEDHYIIPKEIKRIRLAEGKSTLMKLFAIYKYFFTCKTDCVISFGARDNTLCLGPLSLRPKIKVLAGERCATFNGLTWYKKLNYKLLYKRADYIVPNSYTQKEEIIRINPKYDFKTVTITNYTDTSEYSVVEAPINDKIEIGIFCRYSKQKNYSKFTEVVKKLKDLNYSFHVTWYGNKQTKGMANVDYVAFDEMVRRNELQDVLTLNDHTKNVSGLIPRFDALCLPSLAEGFSNSISEYICCGKPVLCSDVADNGIMVKNGENGFLFDPTNIDDMVNAFVKFFNLTPLDREKMGKKSRERAEQLFDKERFVGSYIELIEK